MDPQANLRLPAVGWLVARDITLKANRGFMTPDYNATHQMVLDSRLKLESLVTFRFSLDGWAAAFDAFTDARSQSVQVLIEP